MEPASPLSAVDPVPKRSDNAPIAEVTRWLQALRNLARALIFDQAVNALDPEEGHLLYQG